MPPTVNRTTMLAIAVALAAAVPTATAAAAPKKGPKGDLLFVQSAAGGSYRDGVLTLRGVGPRLVWFSDRPERDSGTVPFKTYRAGLFGRQPAPNAALDIAGKGINGVFPIELRRPRDDPTRQVVTYRIRRLNRVGGDLGHTADRRSKHKLPRSFGAASLFIDDLLGTLCHTDVKNNLPFGPSFRSLGVVSVTKWETDTWVNAISVGGVIPFQDGWEARSGLFRGCSTTAVLAVPSGDPTFTVTTTNPYIGPMTYSCASSNPSYGCRLVIAPDDNEGMVFWELYGGSS